jgi:hypothetical protein
MLAILASRPRSEPAVISWLKKVVPFQISNTTAPIRMASVSA